MTRFFLYIFSIIVLAGCRKETDDPGNPSTIPAQTLLNVSFGSDAKQNMDIYLPAGRTTSSTKVMVLIHGGSWFSGDKSDFTPYVDSLKKRLPGWAIFNINYRLSTGVANLFPSQEIDVKAAVEFIFSKITEYAISDKFVLLGGSSGAHLALLQGYKYTSPVKVKAIVDFFGPTDMTDLYNNPASPMLPPNYLATIVGGTPLSNPTLYQQSSPINFVSAQSPPTIILQGGADPLVAVSQSVSLKNKLQSLGVVHQYVFYPTEGHGWVGSTMSDSFDKIGVFLAANVN